MDYECEVERLSLLLAGEHSRCNRLQEMLDRANHDKEMYLTLIQVLRDMLEDK